MLSAEADPTGALLRLTRQALGVPCAGNNTSGFKWWYGLLAGLGAALLLLAALAGALLTRGRRRQRDMEAQKSADAERARVAVRPGTHSCGCL